MVRGIQKFQEHFKDHTHQYVLIGGAACDLIMQEAAVPFRGTKDLDIVLCVEVLDKAFGEAFWEFIRAGQYKVQQRSSGDKRYYRFIEPGDDNFPWMLELFSRKPEAFPLFAGSRLTPIPLGEDVASLSAILLNDDYYNFLHSGKKMVQGISLVGPEHLIPLKARAWIDLTERKKRGEQVDSDSIKKHKNDIFRLYRIIEPGQAPRVPATILEDVTAFLDAMAHESVDLKNLGIPAKDSASVIAELRRFYSPAV
ncbi:MAG: hypothetical protein HQL22_06960 [Candidatus Omnitrophica bacterium]|nr:hypothetical protein [Candidatus Omnitrophota bacterium]